MTVGSGISAVLSLLALIFSVCTSVWSAEAKIPVRLIVCSVGLTARGGGLGIGSSVGGWLTGVTLMVKVRVKVLIPPLAVPPLSITVTVMCAVPLTFGNTENVRTPVVFGLV